MNEIKPSTTNDDNAYVNVVKSPHWHWLVVFDVWINNLASGLFLVAAIGELLRPDELGHAATIAYRVTFIFLLIDLVLLVADLGDPRRFHHMLRVFKPTSPMSLGTWCLTVFSIPLTMLVALDLMPFELPWMRRLILMVAILPAIGVTLYKGVLFSTSSQPGWRDARWLGGYLTSSAMMLGCIQLLLICAVIKEPPSMSLMRTTTMWMIVLNAVTLGLLWRDLRPTIAKIERSSVIVRSGTVAAWAMTLVPLGMLSWSGWLAAILAAAMLLLGTLGVRVVIVWLPHLAKE